MVLRISNRDARKLWLNSQGLLETPTGSLDVLSIIKKLGFVQLDTIQYVSRAHHHILWSRNQNYREPMLDKLLKTERSVFEHFTHDASVLPMDYYPVWQRQLKRKKTQFGNSNWFSSMLDDEGRQAIKKRIGEEGPLSTHAFDSKIVGKKEMWQRPPHKQALDFMWYCGELSTSHRESFKKFYDLTENVVPEKLRTQNLKDAEQLDRLCQDAMDRIIFGTHGDIKRFWDAVDTAEAKKWISDSRNSLREIEIETANGEWHPCWAIDTIEAQLQSISKPSSRLRLLNPFDPVIRDRDRLKRLFGLDYRIEIFVPKAKRQWGYYVYPLLEGDRFVGRIEVKAERLKSSLEVLGFWREPKITWSDKRFQKLDQELDRLARFVGVKNVNWQVDRNQSLD